MDRIIKALKELDIASYKINYETRETAELYFEGLSYEEAFEKAKEILKDTNKNYK